MTPRAPLLLLALALPAAMTGCDRPPVDPDTQRQEQSAREAERAAIMAVDAARQEHDRQALMAVLEKAERATAGEVEGAPAGGALPLVVVHKSPSCGCCGNWVAHLEQAGFAVEVRDTDEINAVKQRLGVPADKASCHTAEVGGYVVEGHVPAGDIKRLLAEQPEAAGLVLPGMPLGSPGMETPDGRTEPYTVELLGTDGATRPFSRH